MIGDYDWSRLNGLGFDIDYVEKTTGELKEACWKGYTAVGMKKKRGKLVPNCVPVSSKHSENPIDSMAPLHLPELKNPEGGNAKDPFLTSSGYLEGRPNGSMAITQLKSMQENIAVILAMVSPETNLDPWMASKLAEAEHGMTAIADYLKYSKE